MTKRGETSGEGRLQRFVEAIASLTNLAQLVAPAGNALFLAYYIPSGTTGLGPIQGTSTVVARVERSRSMNSIQPVAPPSTTRRREVASVRHLGGNSYKVTVKETVTARDDLRVTASAPAGVSLAFIRMALQESRGLREGG